MKGKAYISERSKQKWPIFRWHGCLENPKSTRKRKGSTTNMWFQQDHRIQDKHTKSVVYVYNSIKTMGNEIKNIEAFCCCSVAQSCPTLGDPMDCRMPGFPVLHHLLELAQTHVYWVSDAIKPYRPLLSPSPAFNLSQHQGIFKWLSSSN